jgi:hypothetical protein
LTGCGNGSANVTGWCFDQQRIVDRGEPDVTYGTGLGVLTAVLAPVVVMEREMVLTCLIEVAAERPCLDPCYGNGSADLAEDKSKGRATPR